MNLTPPQGSRISVKTDGSDHVILVPKADGVVRYPIGLFLLFWLWLWTVGFMDAFSQVVSGSAGIFLIFWLGAWSLGGLFALCYLYRVLRPSVPESLRLQSTGLKYDSGIPPLQMQFGDDNQRDAWKSTFPKRTIVDVSQQQLQSLRLRETDSGNRLTIDAGATRLDIARNANEIEREWLYQLLAKRYS